MPSSSVTRIHRVPPSPPEKALAERILYANKWSLIEINRFIQESVTPTFSPVEGLDTDESWVNQTQFNAVAYTFLVTIDIKLYQTRMPSCLLFCKTIVFFIWLCEERCLSRPSPGEKGDHGSGGWGGHRFWYFIWLFFPVPSHPAIGVKAAINL